MNRELQILFNTKMVRAILEGRKTVTRRVVKFPTNKFTGKIPNADDIEVYERTVYCEKIHFSERPHFSFNIKPQYHLGDILYVRETWQDDTIYTHDSTPGKYFYKADGDVDCYKWKPSIHMPKEAARIWLKVTDVRVERLQDISEREAEKEGFYDDVEYCVGNTARGHFLELWDFTIKKSECYLYGWDANPWVFVYEFERIEHEQ